MYEFCFVVETFDGIKSVVSKIDSTGETVLKVETGLVHLVNVLNDLGSEGWECVGYNTGYRNALNFWTFKRVKESV